MFSRFPCPTLVLTPPSLLVASEGAGRNRALWCRVCKLQEGGGAHVPSSWNPWIPSSREVLGTWSEGIEKERASLPPSHAPRSLVQSSD